MHFIKNIFISLSILVASLIVPTASAQRSETTEIKGQFYVGLTDEALEIIKPPVKKGPFHTQNEIFREAAFFYQYGMLPLKKDPTLKGVYLVQVFEKRQFKRFSESVKLMRYFEPVLKGTSSFAVTNVTQEKPGFTKVVRPPIFKQAPQQQQQQQQQQQPQQKQLASTQSISAGSGQAAVSALTIDNPDPEDINEASFNAETGANIHNAWDKTTGDQNLVVAVLSTGINIDHPDFAGNLWLDPTPSATDVKESVNGFNAFSTNHAKPVDDHGEGSFVSGIIGAKGNNGIGIAGVAWKVKIMPVRIAKKNPTFPLYITFAMPDLIDGMTYILKKKAQGANISVIYNHVNFTSAPPAQIQTLTAKIKEAEDAGILFVTAAGDFPADLETSEAIPGSFNGGNVISVGAYKLNGLTPPIEYSEASNKGKTHVHLAAPGKSVRSCWYTTQGYSTAETSFSLTSGAFVTGVAVLIKAAYPAESVADVKGRILNGVRKYPTQLQEFVKTAGVLDAVLALAPPKPKLQGDYDNNGSVQQADYLLWRSHFGNPAPDPADGNGNGVVDAADYTVWRNNLGHSIYIQGDYDHNGTVQQADYNLWRSHFGSTAPDDDADGNFNGTVDSADYTVWRNNLGKSSFVQGDYDHNGTVQQADYNLWQSHMGSTAPDDAADGSANGVVDDADYVIWRKNLGKTQ